MDLKALGWGWLMRGSEHLKNPHCSEESLGLQAARAV